MKFPWSDAMLVLVVAIGCGTCAYNHRETKRAIIECTKLGRMWLNDTCGEMVK